MHELQPFPPTWLAEACAYWLLDEQHREALVPRRCAHTTSKLANVKDTVQAQASSDRQRRKAS